MIISFHRRHALTNKEEVNRTTREGALGAWGHVTRYVYRYARATLHIGRVYHLLIDNIYQIDQVDQIHQIHPPLPL